MEKEKKKTRPIFLVTGIILVFLMFYFSFGFFVVPPIGAIPKGSTIFYFRLGTNFDFIESPDGLALEIQGGVSLFGRGMALATFVKARESQIIAKLPYMHFMYLISTGGKEFSQ